MCLAESDKLGVPQVITSDFLYAPLRKEEYSPEERREIVERAGQQLAAGREVFVLAEAIYAEISGE
jgi:hypothetical protein